MSDQEHANDKELIIIRRRYDYDADRHHGGVWKIAHADFMTAMMAFFMVMWLISSTDEAAKKHIARYFNPVKLSAMTAFPKGLEDPDPKEQKIGTEATPPKTKLPDHSSSDEASSRTAMTASSGETGSGGMAGSVGDRDGGTETRRLPSFTEAEIFSDPYGVLDRIVMNDRAFSEQAKNEATSAQTADQISDPIQGQIQGQGGAAMRDPFAPLSWQLNPLSLEDKTIAEDASSANFSIVGQNNGDIRSQEINEAGTELKMAATMDANMDAPEDTALTMAFESAANAGAQARAAAEALKQDEHQQQGLQGESPQEDQKALTQVPAPVALALAKLADNAVEADKAQMTGLKASEADKTTSAALNAALNEALAAQVNAFKQILGAALNEDPKPTVGQTMGKEITVTTSGDDILINVSDSANYGMFAIGSSEPTAQSIILLERIAKSLKSLKGDIIIRGHTDGRPFRSGKSDNWYLSTARAHMARFMLIRGGLDENRLLRVEGYADRALKHPDNPQADDNRRIEILVHPVKETKS
ncbi:MotB family protein [uncultured Cohaesibacter sp.]|uniref:MotB family protein n=1 Tax=uncultured Cohaesibacter sp. TaxID=1002546 RepID=UPI0029C6E35B|nr:MotB family protein [uncultured Cohaesibacter sp.]